MENRDRDVVVTDGRWQFLENTRAGKARKLIEQKKAILIQKEPPFIKLRKVVNLNKGGINMDLISINKYFQENSDIFVLNVSGMQVSLTFYYPDGRSDPFTIPNTKIPICITQYVPFDLVKNSGDFRRMIQRKPPRLRLLTLQEYQEEMEKLSKVLELSVEELERKADEAVRYVTEKVVPVVEANMDVKGMKEAQAVIEESRVKAETVGLGNEKESGLPKDVKLDVDGIEGVNPKVIGLCMKLEEARKSGDGKNFASQMILELQNMELTAKDLRYISDNASIKKVKKWALEKLSEVK